MLNVKHEPLPNAFKQPKDPIGFILFLSIATLLLCALVFFIGCRTSKTPEQKQYEATQKELAALRALRSRFPCDTVTRTVQIRDTAIIFTTDTSYIPRLQIGQMDTVVITKYKTVTHNVDHIIKVIDMAALQASRDSAAQSMYLFNQCAEGVAPVVKENTALKAEVKEGRQRRLVLLSALVIIAAVNIVSLVKKFI